MGDNEADLEEAVNACVQQRREAKVGKGRGEAGCCCALVASCPPLANTVCASVEEWYRSNSHVFTPCRPHFEQAANASVGMDLDPLPLAALPAGALAGGGGGSMLPPGPGCTAGGSVPATMAYRRQPSVGAEEEEEGMPGGVGTAGTGSLAGGSTAKPPRGAASKRGAKASPAVARWVGGSCTWTLRGPRPPQQWPGGWVGHAPGLESGAGTIAPDSLLSVTKKMYRGGKAAARGGRGAAAAGPRQASLFEAFGRSASQASPAVGAGGQGTQGSIRVDGAAPR